MANDQRPVRDPYSIRESYEAKLETAKKKALIVAGLQKLSRFFGICALTWASIVLLGGFASDVRLLDFYFISILLLLEAARLSTTQVFSKLLVKTLFREPHRPEKFGFKDPQYSMASRLNAVGQGLSGSFAVTSLVLAVVRFVLASGSAAHQPFTLKDDTKTGRHGHGNIFPALIAFYALVSLNAAAAIASGLFHIISLSQRSGEKNLMRYHEEVYRTAMSSGMLEADDIDIFEFAFNKLSNDHMRNIRPIAIKQLNKDLIEYMYHSPNGVGITYEYMKSGDWSKQVAAANLPGFWASQPRMEHQVALFWALQEKLYGAGKVAEAAANSICSIAKVWAEKHPDSPHPHPFLISDPTKADAANVVDTLINLLIQPIRPSLLFQLRALEACCRSRHVLEHIYKQGREEHDTLRRQLQQEFVAENEDALQQCTPVKELCKKLRNVVVREGSRIRQPTKIYAARVLCDLLRYKGELEEEARERMKRMVLQHLDPAEFMPENEHLWWNEKNIVDNLRTSLGLPMYEHWDRINERIRQPDGTVATAAQTSTESAVAMEVASVPGGRSGEPSWMRGLATKWTSRFCRRASAAQHPVNNRP